MPVAFDNFLLVVAKSVAAQIGIPTYPSDNRDHYVGAGNQDQYIVNFEYIGGFGPTATAFEVAWYDSDSDRASESNALSGTSAPTSTFNPSTPQTGPNERTGSLSGVAPDIGAATTKTYYGRIKIIQAALAHG